MVAQAREAVRLNHCDHAALHAFARGGEDGADFDGVILFDESHAMANAAGSKGERGDTEASQQGRAGLRLQHKLPNARVVYVSATGATTVHNLAYAQRLGLWGGEDFPFATRAEFVQAIEAGGVAAMEVLARDLRSLGLYTARSLSYDGVEYELLEHALEVRRARLAGSDVDDEPLSHAVTLSRGPAVTLDRHRQRVAACGHPLLLRARRCDARIVPDPTDQMS